jgi:hypothetical protein
MTNIKIETKRKRRVAQGDVFRDVECIEYVAERRGIIQVSKVIFPLVVVLTQDCDLEQDARYKNPKMKKPPTDDKRLLSVLVVPLYNAEHLILGTHLSDLKMTMTTMSKKTREIDYLKNNERPRYHYLDFPDEIPIVAQVADFKHYFSSHLRYLESIRSRQFVCRISDMFREHLSQRFAAYLARIGLPDIAAPRETSAPSPPASTAR